MKNSEYISRTARNFLAGATVGLAALVGGSGNSKADLIQFTNQGPAVNGISSFSAVLEDYDHPDTRVGYDRFDQELDISSSLDPKNFVTYFPLNNDGVGFDAGTNFIPNMKVGDTYTAYLAFSGSGVFGVPNKISFSDFDLGDNPNGVTGLEYDLKVDIWGGNGYNHFESGMVSEDMETGSWDQYIFPGGSLEAGRHYGELTFTAIGEPNNTWDLNDDGLIDRRDAALLVRELEASYDLKDFVQLQSKLGTTVDVPSSNSASRSLVGVPEPSTLSLLAIGSGIYWLASSRRRRDRK